MALAIVEMLRAVYVKATTANAPAKMREIANALGITVCASAGKR